MLRSEASNRPGKFFKTVIQSPIDYHPLLNIKQGRGFSTPPYPIDFHLLAAPYSAVASD